MCIQGSSRLMTSYVRPPNLSKVVVRHMISICADLTFDFWAEKSLGLLYESLLRAIRGLIVFQKNLIYLISFISM